MLNIGIQQADTVALTDRYADARLIKVKPFP